MAATSMNDIKSRIKSVSSTMQITKAMELVATSKLRRAKERLESSRPFCKSLGESIERIMSTTDTKNTVWSEAKDSAPTLYVVIAGDRGLAGGYNSNVFRLTESLAKGTDALYLPIGKKALEHYRHKGVTPYSEAFGYVDDISVGDSFTIADSVCRGFISGEIGSVVIVYTRFDSMLSQTTKYKTLLPLESTASDDTAHYDPLFEGDYEELLDKIVPHYVGGIIYSTVCEALASELGARRTAMESANKNAGEIIDTLRLQFNRARQAVITQEITEIVSGSEAL
ncbi:MAG: ATP synthase F1 subunit gamma [Clostridia bacterium]|nr:ATP synthase F1 subunit gamma [Clostridia bacterium]